MKERSLQDNQDITKKVSSRGRLEEYAGTDKKVPKLRFKGFKDEWMIQLVSEFAEVVSGGNTRYNKF